MRPRTLAVAVGLALSVPLPFVAAFAATLPTPAATVLDTVVVPV